MSRYEQFDRTRIELWDWNRRGHDLVPEACWKLDAPATAFAHPDFAELLAAIRLARRNGRPVILMMGAHLIKLGLSRFVIDLMERGLITQVATNGAGIIHDFELSCGAGTSENVPRWIQLGQFGLWQQTSHLNRIIQQAARRGEGLGEAVGRAIEEDRQPRRDLSIAASGYRCGVPVTSHVSIGSDIIHAHPNCDGAALGAASYTDFLIFARAVEQLEQGVFLNVGTSVTGPEVYLKALAMARNAARREVPPRSISNFVTAVFDLVELPADFRVGPPDKSHPMYYFRPWKTILVRTVADGGRSFYFCGDHQQTVPSLWHGLTAVRSQAA
jgi:hypothetical protein